MRHELDRLLHEISLRIQEESDEEVRWDANTLCDYICQFLNLKHCSPSNRLRLWQSLVDSAFPIEAQMRLEKYNGTFLKEDINWLLNFLYALNEAIKLAKCTRPLLPVGYDSSTREFLFEWAIKSGTEMIVEAAYEKKSLQPGLLENWIKHHCHPNIGTNFLFAECFWTEFTDCNTDTVPSHENSAPSNNPKIIDKQYDSTTKDIELTCTNLTSDSRHSQHRLRVSVWQLESSSGRKAYISSFHDASGRVVETNGPFLSFPEIEKELQNQGIIERWKFF